MAFCSCNLPIFCWPFHRNLVSAIAIASALQIIFCCDRPWLILTLPFSKKDASLSQHTQPKVVATRSQSPTPPRETSARALGGHRVPAYPPPSSKPHPEGGPGTRGGPCPAPPTASNDQGRALHNPAGLCGAVPRPKPQLSYLGPHPPTVATAIAGTPATPTQSPAWQSRPPVFPGH